jgi:hypothetical protein
VGGRKGEEREQAGKEVRRILCVYTKTDKKTHQTLFEMGEEERQREYIGR